MIAGDFICTCPIRWDASTSGVPIKDTVAAGRTRGVFAVLDATGYYGLGSVIVVPDLTSAGFADGQIAPMLTQLGDLQSVNSPPMAGAGPQASVITPAALNPAFPIVYPTNPTTGLPYPVNVLLCVYTGIPPVPSPYSPPFSQKFDYDVVVWRVTPNTLPLRRVRERTIPR